MCSQTCCIHQPKKNYATLTSHHKPPTPPQKKTLGIIIIFKSHFGENTILKESIHLMDLGMVLSIFKDYLGKLFVLVIYGARLK